MATRGRPTTIPITEIEHSAFCKTEDELPSKSLAEEMAVNIQWQGIPPEYLHLTAQDLDQRILQSKSRLGSSVTILGHHYQREEVIKYADFQGDSFLLSREAASRTEAGHIVFCGVHFMAESARIVARPEQRVFHPNLNSGCPMADMATGGQMERALKELNRALPDGDGLEVVRHISAHYQDLPVAMITAFGSMDTAIAALKNYGFSRIGYFNRFK